MNDKDWRKEYLGMKIHSKKSRELLENGAKSLSQSWWLQGMYNDWKKIKGIKDEVHENEGQLQSSFKEFEKSINHQSTNKSNEEKELDL